VGDFDSDFNPLNDHTRDRWINIAAPAPFDAPHPPRYTPSSCDSPNPSAEPYAKRRPTPS
jgi:hypothetical protein